MRTSNKNSVRWASGLNVIAGIWLLISPWVLHFNMIQAATWDAVVFGILVVIFAAIHGFVSPRAVWLSWINAIIGLWLIVSSWVLKVDMNAIRADMVALGIIVAVLALWSGFSSTASRTVVT